MKRFTCRFMPFLEYWVAHLPRRRREEIGYEFGHDTGTLVVVLQEAAKKFAALPTEPARRMPDPET